MRPAYRRPALVPQRGGFELRLDAHRFGDLERGFDLVEELRLPGGGAQALAARTVGVGFEDPQRLFQQADALFACLDAGTQLGVSTRSAARSSAVSAVSVPTGGLSNMQLLSHVESPVHHEMLIFIALYALSADALQLQLTMPFGPHIKPVEQLIKLRPAHRHRVARAHPWPDESLLL